MNSILMSTWMYVSADSFWVGCSHWDLISSYRSKSSGNSYRETSGSLSSGSYSSKPKSANKPTYNSYDSYDDGYDDVYMEGDYDYDRYDRDSDYADGVDDAMDELGED